MPASIEDTPLGANEVKAALANVGLFPPDWVPPRAGTDTDVVIVGAGQAGLSVAFGLRRAGISRIRLIDAAEPGEQGVWNGHAYMPNLRTPLINPGPELGVPDLSLAAWYDRRHGEGRFAALLKCPTEDWVAYLDWFRDVLDIEVDYRTRLVSVESEDDALRLRIVTPDGTRDLVTRKLVLATGLAGSGRARIPSIISEALPAGRYNHSIDRIDTERLRGKRVGVIGSSTSAFDMASIALEAGAVTVDMLSRRSEIVTVAKFAAAAYTGAAHAHLLSDEELWDISVHYLDQGSPPPIQSVERAVRHDRFSLHLNAPLQSASFENGRITLRAGGDEHVFDHLLCATGFETDLTLRPELAGVATLAATWADRLPKAEASNNPLGRFPYLSHGFSLHERSPGEAPWIGHIHVFNYAAHIGVARSVGDISSLTKLVPRLVETIGGSLFIADRAAQLARLKGPPLIFEGLERHHYAHRIAQRRHHAANAEPAAAEAQSAFS